MYYSSANKYIEGILIDFESIAEEYKTNKNVEFKHLDIAKNDVYHTLGFSRENIKS